MASREVEELLGGSEVMQQARDAERQRKLKARADTRNQMIQDLEVVRNDRRRDMAEGRARGEELFGEGKLGRVEAGRSQEIADIIAQRKAGLKGFSNQESNAMRERGVAAVNSETQGSLRSLRAAQGAGGVRGGMAAAQVGRVRQAADAKKAEMERDLFLKNEEVKRGALDSLEKSTTGAREDELGREKFNIEQSGKEKFGQISSEMGYAQLGSAERNGVMQNIIGQDQADAMLELAKNRGKK